MLRRAIACILALVAELATAAYAVITPSETASYARLLTLAGALDATGREKLAEFAERSFTGDLALQVAYDIVAGRRRHLGSDGPEGVGAPRRSTRRGALPVCCTWSLIGLGSVSHAPRLVGSCPVQQMGEFLVACELWLSGETARCAGDRDADFSPPCGEQLVESIQR